MVYNVRVILIYDCPKASCSKLWVLRELEKNGYNVKAIYSRYPISNIEQKGKTGKLLARLLVLWQAIKGVIFSNKEDVVFCWNNFNALYFNLITGGKRRIISYNWLTPTPRKKTLFLYQRALNNSNLKAIINFEGNKEVLLEAYQVEDHHNIHYIPDVYDDSVPFIEPNYNIEDKYIFSGGRANRDWKLFLEIARQCPDLRFVGVAAVSDWDKSLSIPENVTMHYDLPANEYYEMMCKAYLTIYPLAENKVSGLVNIVKSIQMGKIVIVSNLPVTNMYYPEQLKELLISNQNIIDWKRVISYYMEVDDIVYMDNVLYIQEHIKMLFSPQIAGQKLNEVISELNNVS